MINASSSFFFLVKHIAGGVKSHLVYATTCNLNEKTT